MSQISSDFARSVSKRGQMQAASDLSALLRVAQPSTFEIPIPETFHPITDPVHSHGPIAVEVWKQVGVDVIGPLTETSNGNKYIITLIDYFSKWPEAEAVPDKSAKTVACFLYRIMTRLGSMKMAFADHQDREFINETNEELFRLSGTRHQIGSAIYHPQTKDLRIFNQTLERSLVKFCTKDKGDWDQHMDTVLFGYRTAVHAETKVSPFFMMYGGREPLPPVSVVTQQNLIKEECLEDTNDVSGWHECI